MAATIGPRALRPLRSCPSLLSVSRSHAAAQSRTNSSYTRLSATPNKKAAASSTTPIKPTYARNRPAAPAKSAAAAPAARPRVEYPPGVLDPQAAVVPPESAPEPRTAASSLPPVPEPSPFASGFSSPQSNGNGAGDGTINWSESYHGLATTPFSSEAAAILMAPLDPLDVEVKPDGIIYLPEIKYRRILNRAFGPGGWGLAPRGDLIVGEKVVTREYALVVHGRFVAQARGENPYFSDETIPTAGEGCKSNALMRCCKDLGIGSEMWDPRFIREFKKTYAREIWVEHVVNKKKRQIWIRKDGEPGYPYKKSP